MLEGVNVVETITSTATPWYILVFVAFIALFIIVDFVVNCIRADKEKKCQGLFGNASFVFAIACDTILIACTIIASVLLYDGYNTVRTTYRVTVDKSVSFVEFHDRYEVLLEDGDEYIIREITSSSQSE